MKKIIINADDFGLSSAINRGIIEAHRYGVLTSTSLLANGRSATEAIELAKLYRNLGVGVHLCLVQGRPVSDPVTIPSLVNKDGIFFNNYFDFFFRFFRGQIHLEDIEKELNIQIEKVIKFNINITHIDTHQHLHMHPTILKILIKLAHRFKIRTIRYCSESPSAYLMLLKRKNFLKYFFLNLRKKCVKKLLLKSFIIHSDFSKGIYFSGQITTEVLRQFILTLKEGVSEIICHPGSFDENLSEIYPNGFTNFCWTGELKALLDPSIKKIIFKSGISLINFSQL